MAFEASKEAKTDHAVIGPVIEETAVGLQTSASRLNGKFFGDYLRNGASKGQLTCL